MAAKRIAASSINWIAFAESVPENQKLLFQAFKSKSDKYLNKALSLPENPPKIDWAAYRKSIATAGIVDKFEKEYSAFKVPFPKENVMSQIDDQERAQQKMVEDFIQQSQEQIAKHKVELQRWVDMMPIEHMTMDDFKDNFPDIAFDPLNRPTFFPHDDVEDEESTELVKGH
uniref:ATP synthase subunit d, mitochondrial n=1 Tax=Hemiscolopendra marginata TaxID=943146 RepID=A0A646QE72_9MYRI